MDDNGFAKLPLASIREPAHQLRERIDPEALGQLADSIAAEGLHQPIGVRGPDGDGHYEIIFGHRRYLAHQLLRRAVIECRVFPPDFDPLLAAVSENLNREALNPVEEALAVREFTERGQSRAGIARLFRRSPAWVDARIALLDYPPDIIAAIRGGHLSLAVAALLADVDHTQYRGSLIAEAARHGASASTVAVWRQHYLADRERIHTNALAIEAVIQERDKYVVRYPCDWCDEEHELRDTRTARLCVGCMNQLAEAKAAATAR